MMRTIPMTLLLTGAFFLSLLFNAQAQTTCSGSGVYKSCLTRSGSGYSYSSPYRSGHANVNGQQLSQKAQSIYTNKKAAAGTLLNNGRTNAANTYQGIKNSRSNFTCDERGCRQQ